MSTIVGLVGWSDYSLSGLAAGFDPGLSLPDWVCLALGVVPRNWDSLFRLQCAAEMVSCRMPAPAQSSSLPGEARENWGATISPPLFSRFALFRVVSGDP